MGKRIWPAAAVLFLLAVLLPAAAVAPKLVNSQSESRPLEGPQEGPVSAGSEASPENGGGSIETWEIKGGTRSSAEKAAEPAVTLTEIRAAGPSDIPPDTPAYDAASYLMYHGILRGWEDGRFAPYEMVTRGTAVTALYRFSGDAAPEKKTAFSDANGQYADAAAWAAEAGIAQGIGDGRFGTSQPINRGQLAVILYRFAQKQGLMPENLMIAASLDTFPDGNAVPGYAREAVSWALGNGIFNGIVGESILSGAPVSRLQLAQAVTALAGMKDGLASEIHAAQPARVFQSTSRDCHGDIQAAIEDTAGRYGVTGLQVAVVENGELCDTYTYGWATQGQSPMTENHKMRIASISKVMVGIAAMLLQEEGVVDLDTEIGKYWGFDIRNPYYPEAPITLRTLLTHTSSLPAVDDAGTSYNSVKQRLQAGGFRNLRPGAMGSWSYSNYGFSVLGMTLELAANRRLDAVLEERLLRLMEIDGAFGSGDIQDPNLLVTLYRGDHTVGRSVESQKNTHIKGRPGETGAFFAGGSWQALPMRYRSGLYGRRGIYYHTGSAYGAFNCMSYDPETGDGVVVLTSGGSSTQDGNHIYSACSEINAYIYNIIRNR